MNLEAIEQDISAFVSASNKKRKRQLEALTPQRLELEWLQNKIRACCETVEVATAVQLYKYAKERGLVLSKAVYYNLLNLTAGFGDAGSGSTQVRPLVLPFDLDATRQIFHDMCASGVECEESAHTAVIRCYCQHDLADEALALYTSMHTRSTPILPRNRTLSPLLHAYAQRGDAAVVEQVFFVDLIDTYKLTPTERDYCAVLELVRKNKDQQLFHRVFEHLKEDFFTLHSGTIDILRSVFTTVFEQYTVMEGVPNTEGLITFPSSGGVELTRQLVSIEITAAQRELMTLEIFKYASEVQHTRTARQTSGSASSESDWDTFRSWLAGKERSSAGSAGEREHVFIDGANVGYFENNYLGAPAHVDFDKIQWVITEVCVCVCMGRGGLF